MEHAYQGQWQSAVNFKRGRNHVCGNVGQSNIWQVFNTLPEKYTSIVGIGDLEKGCLLVQVVISRKNIPKDTEL